MTPTHILSARGWYTGTVYHWFSVRGEYYAVTESDGEQEIVDYKGNYVPASLFIFLKPILNVTDDMRRGL